MVLIQALQIGLTLLVCALAAATVMQLRRRRHAEEQCAAALREAIAQMDERQIAHRDALVEKVADVLREVMNATEPRTVVIGPKRDEGGAPAGKPNLRVVPPPDEEPPEPDER